MKSTAAIILLILAASLPAAELSTIDRSIAKEPVYRGKPAYCLLVFGEALNKVWLVEDGDRLYVDRNANGDLTEADEVFEPSSRERDHTQRYMIKSLFPSDGSRAQTDLALWRQEKVNDLVDHQIYLKVSGKMQQEVTGNLRFAASRQQAPVFWFGGPLTAKALQANLSLKKGELNLSFVSPAVGSGSFHAYLCHEAIPKSVQPVAEIQWPGEGADLLTKVKLTERC